MIVGQNQAGFTLSFAPSEATVVDAEFKAMPDLDNEGTLVNYVEEIKDAEDPEQEQKTYKVEQNLTNVQSSFTGTTVNEGDRMTAILTAEDNHTIQTPTVIMNSQDITATAWEGSTGTVTIESVTGDVIITASATENA